MRKSMEEYATYIDFSKSYPELPEKLRPFYCYFVIDHGHSLMAMPKIFLSKAMETGNYCDYEIPVPVKYVINKEYEVGKGYLSVDIPYDSEYGADIDEEYMEF